MVNTGFTADRVYAVISRCSRLYNRLTTSWEGFAILQDTSHGQLQK